MVLVSSLGSCRFLRRALEEGKSCLNFDLVDLVEVVRGDAVLGGMDARVVCTTRSLVVLFCFMRIRGELRCRGLRPLGEGLGMTTGLPAALALSG